MLEVEPRGWIVGVAAISLFVGVRSGVGLWLTSIPCPSCSDCSPIFFNVLPYLGSTVGALPPTRLALTTDRPPLNALLVLPLFVALNQLEGYVLQPLVMGR